MFSLSESLARRILPAAFLFLLAGAAAAAPAAPKEKAVLESAAFTADLQGWERQGKAEFAADAGVAHAGHASVRITVAPGAVLEYQQLHRDCSTDILPGDVYRAAVWVRTRGVETAPGAYLALEFVGDAGQRVGIAHSKMGPGIGKNDWEQLTAEGTAPAGAKMLRVSLILHAVGAAWFADVELVRAERPAPWPDLGGARRAVTIRTGQTVQQHFGGVGFHVFHHAFPESQTILDTVIFKRWREMNPSFARMNDQWDWDREHRDRMADYLREMKRTGAEVYVTTWNPEQAQTDAARAAYAEKVVDNLEYLVRQKGADNIKYYCMTNELSLGGWGKLNGDLPLFKAYHQALYQALKARKLNIGLLATDASPFELWNSIAWAAENMDDITAVYGGHHYINDRALEDERFYPWFLRKLNEGTAIARAKGKPFLLGEFGSKQDGRTLDGVKRDVCIYFDTPQEALSAIQISEAVIAALNAGVHAMGYWTFMDCPDEGFSKTYINKWGTFRCTGSDYSTRDLYYAYGLLTKFLRGPGTVFAVESSDPRLRVAALRQDGRGSWSIAVVNRNKREVPVTLTLDGKPLNALFRKYVYDPAHVPQNRFGDLQGPSGTAPMRAGSLSDHVGPYTLTVYTTAYDDHAPAPVRGVKAARGDDGKVHIAWLPSVEPDLCYYRVFRGTSAGFQPGPETQIGSTIATQFVDDAAVSAGAYYKVIAVDQSGNAGKGGDGFGFSRE